MARILNKDASSSLAAGMAKHLRSSEYQYISGGAAVQRAAISRLDRAHRPTWDLDLTRVSKGEYHFAHMIKLPQTTFRVDVNCVRAAGEHIPASVLISDGCNFHVMLSDRTKLSVSYQGKVRYESLESSLIKKADTIANRLHERRGEAGKDLFDIGLLASFVDQDFVAQHRSVPHITEIFHISSSLLGIYPNKMAKRVSSELPVGTIVELSGKGAANFSSSKSKIAEFAEANPIVLPAMLLAASNQQLRERIIVMQRMASERPASLIETNRAITHSLIRKEKGELDRAAFSLIKNLRELRMGQ